MHLHDLLRAWRAEIVSPHPAVAVADDETSVYPPEALLDRERMSIPGRLRRDEPDTIKATLLPARHEPGKPATDEALDAFETGTDLILPRPLELLLRLHDGGSFFIPDVPDLSDDLKLGLRLLSASEIVEAYQEVMGGISAALAEEDPDEDDLERIAGRFGAYGEGREALVAELDALMAGAETGLGVIPLLRAPGTRNYITYVPHAGRDGRVGYAFSDAGYLPEDSMEYAFEGLEGWLLAILKSRACRRIVLT